jgi:hypothetical protein
MTPEADLESHQSKTGKDWVTSLDAKRQSRHHAHMIPEADLEAHQSKPGKEAIMHGSITSREAKCMDNSWRL